MNWQRLLGVERLRESARYWLDEGGLAVADRLDLAQLEWRKQWTGLVGMAIAVALLLMFLFGALIVGSLAVMLAYWQSPQWHTALWVLGGAWGGLLLIALLVIVMMKKRMAKPFVLTRTVLAQDFRAMKERL
ncbi:hypothetical protein CLI92_03835 [Vandammella animalimorsus]|uniref:Phage holin family protein n=1 Tax=Vandammella animalimorsus TaxID=2029117 RepID=A0A2A2T7Z1_9BURK|nr:phage holin family protein [Vandammella animalimorsus]PAT31809.1 hypothetical protein CK626_08370 [Vandammella animalimorsus]PAT35432.1 hypothetical protein CK620_06120 [Vandammella animalimorsus]PAX17951.1 hypothetical protein CLI92_03835 [Vandammella animalimorsus]PAX20105.1 hypothetical protein CLI93_05260 [Vandammella animalimorsus]